MGLCGQHQLLPWAVGLAGLATVTLVQAQSDPPASPVPAASPTPGFTLPGDRVVRSDTDATFFIWNGFLVFFMQVGFVALETGSGRAKNVRNILLKNLVDVMLAAIVWWALGYAFAYGKTAAGVIGYSEFFYESDVSSAAEANPTPKPWFFSFTFVVACCTIVSGCLAERTRLVVYPLYTLVIAALVHPLLVHWIWTPKGWLNGVSTCNVLDWAGGTVVHMVGGLFGLVGAVLCGPRLGRFDGGLVKEIPGHDMAFVTLGTFMLWFGWYGFNAGSIYSYANPNGATVQRVAMNTTLGAAAGGLAALLVASWWQRTYDLRISCNGVLSGLVVVTSMCGFVDPWAAVVGGTIAGAVYTVVSHLLLKFGIDDPLDSAPVHAINGILGMLMTAFMAKPAHVALVVGEGGCGGIFYTKEGWMQLAMQVLAIAVTMAFSVLSAVVLFLGLRWYGALRVDQATELAGIDHIDHGGPAYPEFNMYNYASNGSVHGHQRGLAT